MVIVSSCDRDSLDKFVIVETRYVVVCDSCGNDPSSDEFDRAKLLDHLVDEGWAVMGGELCCPHCKMA